MCAPLLFHSNLSTLSQGNATARSPGGIASFGYSADVVLVEPGPGRIQCTSAPTSSEGEGSETVKLQWESARTSYSATGGSGHRYKIVVLYPATKWGPKRARAAGVSRQTAKLCTSARCVSARRQQVFWKSEPHSSESLQERGVEWCSGSAEARLPGGMKMPHFSLHRREAGRRGRGRAAWRGRSGGTR